MAKKTKPNPRKHIPALKPEQLTVAIQKLQDAKLPPAAKEQLGRMIQAAANPENETVAVIIQTLPPNRRKRIQSTVEGLHKNMQTVTSRAKQSLLDMSAAEWERLVEEANADA